MKDEPATSQTTKPWRAEEIADVILALVLFAAVYVGTWFLLSWLGWPGCGGCK